MRRKGALKRWAPLLLSGGMLFSTGLLTNCRDTVSSWFGLLTSPGRGGQDTDGDGYTDAQELAAGSDAFDPTSTPNNP
ncbi:MAG: hypothetical protein IPM13_14050 [Phycisphaerales bacterium]|nr:hypothetical protein [Phycisphaerales bacterium]